MTDDLKRAMEALEREVCASLESDDHGINDPAVITFAQAQVVIAALRERERAIEQARKDEREALYLSLIDMARGRHPEAARAFEEAAIRARGAR